MDETEKPLLKELPKAPTAKLRIIKGVPVCGKYHKYFITPEGKSVPGGNPCGRPAVHVCELECREAFCSTHVEDHSCNWGWE